VVWDVHVAWVLSPPAVIAPAVPPAPQQ